jgi:hypothetical protein
MATRQEIELLRAEVNYYRDRAALLRAKLYRWGLGSTPRLEELERKRQQAERRLREHRRSPVR